MLKEITIEDRIEASVNSWIEVSEICREYIREDDIVEMKKALKLLFQSQLQLKLEEVIGELLKIKECATEERFPFYKPEERPQLMSDEIDDLISKLQQDRTLKS